MARHVVVIGAGIGGLSAALALAARGVRVTVLERAATPGGKLRQQDGIDAGPTVFTLRWVLDELFAEAGLRLDDHLPLRNAELLARHAWPDGTRLDLFADLARSADAIANFAGPREAQGFRDFAERAARTWRTLEHSFIRAQRPSPVGLATTAGLRDLWAAGPFATLWAALGEHFSDPRLRQLFGRYATYCGSSPFLAPATLMLVAHVEQAGVWYVEGGMHRIATALAQAATNAGATLRYDVHVATIGTANRRVTGVTLATGEHLEADAVIANADAAALGAGLFGRDAAKAVPSVAPADRSLSAITWTLRARPEGFPLVRHNVFFSADYAAEFAALRDRVPPTPTVYICAQDRHDDATPPAAPERLLVLVNAPANGQRNAPEDARAATDALLARAGLTLHPQSETTTTPADFAALLPGTGGALYGRAVHGPMATFARPAARTALKGLYLAGGSTHPGAGLPMAAMSGRLAAAALLQDLRA